MRRKPKPYSMPRRPAFLFTVLLWTVVLIFFVFNSLAHAQSPATGAVWTAEHDWLDRVSPDSSETWEDRYSEWVRDGIDEKLFTNPQSPVYGIPTDCAEAVYTIRALFAYENHLPFIVRGGSGYITNAQSIPGRSSQQRFRSFILYLESHVNTGTLSRDTYPVSVDRKNLRPGAILLYYENSNKVSKHSHTLHGIDDFGITQFLSSTEPRTVRNLSVEEGIDRAPFTQGQDGLRAWHHYYCNSRTGSRAGLRSLNCNPRTGSFSVLAAEPGSYEDYERHPENFPAGFVDQYRLVDPDRPEAWGDAIANALEVVGEVPEEKLKRLANNVCDSLHLREENVNKGLAYMKTTGNRCANNFEWDEYSTPNEDKKIWLQFKIIDQFIAKYCDDSVSCKKMINLRDANFSTCTLFTGTPQETDLNVIREKYKKRLLSADPNDSWNQRWGIDPSDPRDTRAGHDMDDPDGLFWKDYIDKPVSFSGCHGADDLRGGPLRPDLRVQ